MPSSVQASAPGKVILHGEHAVVYGKAAVAVSVDLRTMVQIESRDDDIVTIELGLMGVDLCWKIDQLARTKIIKSENVGQVLNYDESMLQITDPLIKGQIKDDDNMAKLSANAFLLLYLGITDSYCNSKRLPMAISVASDLPCGAGLGSSSAYSVALAGALFKYYNVDVERDVISSWAYQMDRMFHGKPSGIDNSICTYGGALLFQNGSIQEKITSPPSLEVILVNTKVPRNTKTLVAKAKSRIDLLPKVYQHVLDGIEEITIKAWSMMKGGSSIHEATMELCIEANQNLLNSLGAGHTVIDKILSTALSYGFKGKLTGAGGGGCVFIYIIPELASRSQELIDDLKGQGFDCWRVILAGKGLEN